MRKKTARIISFLLHPSFIAILATFLIVYKNTSSVLQAFEWSVVATVFASAIFGFEYYGVKKGIFSNFDVSKRTQRTPLFIFVISLLFLFIFMLVVLRGPFQLVMGAICLTASLVIFLVVNSRIKASVHVAGMTSFLLSMGIIFGGYVYLGLLLVPVIAWARVKIHRHTIPEVIVGGALGIFLTLTSYLVIQYLH